MRQHLFESSGVNTGTVPTALTEGTSEEEEQKEQKEGTGRSSCEGQQVAMSFSPTIILNG